MVMMSRFVRTASNCQCAPQATIHQFEAEWTNHNGNSAVMRMERAHVPYEITIARALLSVCLFVFVLVSALKFIHSDTIRGRENPTRVHESLIEQCPIDNGNLCAQLR